MRRFYLLRFVLSAIVILGATNTFAQNITAMGPRLFVNQPSGIAGLKKFTYSSSSTTGAWGRALDSSWFNVQLVRSDDSLGCSQPTSANYSGKWVLIWRSICEFGQKAKNAQDKGAAGVIIINHYPGEDAVGMAAGSVGSSVTIPVLMVSNPDGIAMWNALGSGTVNISLTRWGFGNSNDLAIVPKSGAPGPGSIPLNSWKSGNGNPDAYKFYTGAFVANVGTATQTNVKVATTLTFTPTGGSPTVVNTDSVIIPTITAADSILEGLSPRSFSVNPTTTGTYTLKYILTSSNTDQNPMDDTVSYSLNVTTNAFCKARLAANGNPIVTGGTRVGGTTQTPFVWGPLLHVASPNAHRMQALKYAISDGDTTRDALTGSTVAYIFKWADGNSDKIIQPSELTLKATALKEFNTSDSNNQVFTAYIGNPDGTAGIVNTEPNSWYWIVVDMPGDLFLGTDGEMSYFNRTNAAKNASTPVSDFWSPAFFSSKDGMLQSSGSNARMIPFGVTDANSANIDSAVFSSTVGTVPALSFEISPFPVSVENTVSEKSQFELFPNPATEAVNIKLSLDKASDKVQVRIVDAIGRTAQIIDRTNLQNETITVSTAGLQSGNYYAVVIANGYATIKQFVVATK